jgi:hypothetical protein
MVKSNVNAGLKDIVNLQYITNIKDIQHVKDSIYQQYIMCLLHGAIQTRNNPVLEFSYATCIPTYNVFGI